MSSISEHTDHLYSWLGGMDIYLMDQIFKRRYDRYSRVLDAGCGQGRNIRYFLKAGFDVHAVDQNSEHIAILTRAAAELAPALPASNFAVGRVEDLPYADNYFDLVICSAMLHFAGSLEHFDQMFASLWRVLRPGGSIFIRLASSIGIEKLIDPVGGQRYNLPDGSQRFLVDEAQIHSLLATYDAQLLDPIKTTNVQNLRCMTTLCLAK